MIERKALSVSLTPELHGFVRELVDTGRYGSASEVVRAGLRLLQEREGRSRPTSDLPAPPAVPLAFETR